MSRYVQAYIRRPDGNEVVYTIRNRSNYRAFKSALKSILIEFYDMSVRVEFLACGERDTWCGRFIAQYRLSPTATGYRLVRSIIERSPVPSSYKGYLCVFDVFKFLNTL